jgi:hypothetical protein
MTKSPLGMTCLLTAQVRQHLHWMGRSAAAAPKALSDTLRDEPTRTPGDYDFRLESWADALRRVARREAARLGRSEGGAGGSQGKGKSAISQPRSTLRGPAEANSATYRKQPRPFLDYPDEHSIWRCGERWREPPICVSVARRSLDLVELQYRAPSVARWADAVARVERKKRAGHVKALAHFY